MNSNALFSSSKADWETPDSLFESLNHEFRFTLDAAANPSNAKCDRFICEDFWYRSQAMTEALDVDLPWYGRVWLNPPYGRGIGEWIKRAKLQALWNAQVVVLLVPARTDTAWWHDYIWDTAHARPQDGVEVRLLRGRIRFKGAPSSAPFPSAVIVLRSPEYRNEGGPNG